PSLLSIFFFHTPAPPDTYTLSLHDALPISGAAPALRRHARGAPTPSARAHHPGRRADGGEGAGPFATRRSQGDLRDGDHAERTRDRKSTRLNSSHVAISYAVFCLKKKKK